jgi:hypothetical protein
MATVEYAALAVLVSVVTAVGGAAVGGERIPLAVAAQMRLALCLVQGGDCLGPGGPRPCVVRTDRSAEDRRVSIAVLRLADGRTVVREVRSDGSVAVTVLLSDQAGGALMAGGRLLWRGRGVQAGAEAGAGARAVYGRRFVVADGAAADRLIARLREEDPKVGGAVGGIARFLLDDGDPADERSVELGGRAEAAGVLEALGIKASAGGPAGVAGGVRVDRRTGERTLVLRLDRGLAATLAAPLGLARAGGGRTDEVLVETTYDRRGRAVALAVTGSAAVHGDVAAGGAGSRGGDRVEAQARLDLADPTARALLDDLVARAQHADAVAATAAARALAVRLADQARIDVRTYATSRTEKVRGGRVALLGEAGYEHTTLVESARLVAAHGREPGGGWSPRLDCVLAA